MAEKQRKLEEMNLLDNFLFGSLVTYPDYGEAFSKYLLKTVLNRDLGKVKVIPQNIYYGSDVTLHGAILDVYIEEDDCEEGQNPTMYDVEPERDAHEEAIKAIPRRMRFYRAKMDGRSLRAGEPYGKLKNLAMIMITPFDPFGSGRMRYTVKNTCIEDPEMEFDDGAVMIFLNTKGNGEQETKALRQLLRYMEDSVPENAVSEDLRELHGMVERVKHDEEVSVQYMRLWESEESIRRKALEEGIEEGQAKERINTEKERSRAEQERARAEEEKQRAEAAESRADAAEKECKRLKAILDSMNRS